MFHFPIMSTEHRIVVLDRMTKASRVRKERVFLQEMLDKLSAGGELSQEEIVRITELSEAIIGDPEDGTARYS